ncbi:hypothetical protein M406DRAFT_106078 [Cryphonectria parasitica EP155]|uniref:BZIP domain-containing protein n=1 Tax=Cryphonectria parasitica (strain ATCC 38755 / EP155) TaxID=660469 RepID=A0A9P4Y475_CRYP1|nr:uncharacterized protein M406DRAFT_106078 [Cryphonectria parasitica EP155]KAF3766062.1 hypothetical protein M406DRAFT_106078 [Cryphonectria parasitica EP155]
MANFNRRATNLDLVQFMREGHLNTINTNEPQEDFSGLENSEGLDLFTNQDFFDFDEGIRRDFKPNADSAPSTKPAESTSATPIVGEFGSMDFGLGSTDFGFSDFNNTYSPINGNFSDGIGLQPLQPSPSNAYPPVPHQHASFSHHAVAQPKGSDKRRGTEPQVNTRALNIEEASRMAAEEDKRRRNTAASARFRVKKKQREQALEKSAKEMSDKVSQLESKISQLETENQWLKKLILEKNDGSDLKADVSKMNGGTKDEIKVETGNSKESEHKGKGKSS